MREAGDAERLVILLEAKVNELEKNMAKASGVTAKTYRQMSLGSRRATQQMEADAIRSTLRVNQALASTSARVGEFSGSFAAGAIAPIAGLLTLTAVVNKTREAINQFGDIADRATETGLDVEYFQGLAYGAKLAGVEFDGFSKALTTFAKNAGLAVEGKGKMVTQLQALNPELLKSIQLAETQEQRVRLAADAINNASDAAQKAALASALFEDQGITIAKAFDGGAEAIDRTVAKARDMGIVIDRELIAKAEEYGDQWDTAAQIIDTKVKVALANLAPGMVWLLDRLVDLTREAENFGDALASPRDFLAWLGGGSGAESRLRDVFRSMQSSTSAEPAVYYDPNGRLIQETPPAFDSIGPGLNARDLEKWFGVTLRQSVPPIPTGGATPQTAESSDGVARSTFDFRKYLDQWYNDSLEGYPDIFRETTKAAGETTKAVMDNSSAVTELSERWQTAQDMAQSFASTFISGMRSGKSAIEAAMDALGNLGDQLISMAANQAIQALFSSLSGGLVGGFGSIAGGAPIPARGFIPGLTGPRLFADGTANTGGRIGEPRGIVHGQEAVIPLPSGGKVPVDVRQASDARPLTMNITVNQSAELQGSNITPDEIRATFEQAFRDYTKQVPAIVNEAIQYGQIRW